MWHQEKRILHWPHNIYQKNWPRNVKTKTYQIPAGKTEALGKLMEINQTPINGSQRLTLFKKRTSGITYQILLLKWNQSTDSLSNQRAICHVRKYLHEGPSSCSKNASMFKKRERRFHLCNLKENRKRKCSSLTSHKSVENGPLDKVQYERDAKEGWKKGRLLIDCVVKVEYQEGGKTLYLGWLLGTTKSYNNRKD